eukprot:4319008-Amphidinium_carterae.4
MAAFESLVIDKARVSQSLNQSGVRELYRIAEEGKLFLKSWVENCLASHPMSPVLFQYSLDTTPLKVMTYYSAGAGRRKQSSLMPADYLVQVLAVTMGGDVPKHMLYFKEPVMLEQGKSNKALAGIAAEFLQGSGVFESSERLRIVHQIHDRGMSYGLRCYISGHVMQLVESSDECVGDSNEMLMFHVQSGCCLHDCHNALRWVWASILHGTSDTLRLLYNGVAVYRRSVSASVSILSSWLSEVLEGRPIAHCQSEDVLTQFYRLLGMDAAALDVVCSEMHLWWNAATSRLEVLDSYLLQEDCIQEISSVLLQVWRFPSFVSSRWLTVGCSLRCLLLGFSLGYHSCFEKMRVLGIVSDYEGSICDGFKAKVVEFAAVIGVCAYLPESILSRLMADNRLMAQWTETFEEMSEELSMVLSLSDSTWQLLGLVVGEASVALRSKVVFGTLLAASYLHARVFHPTSLLPWSLCIGNISNNVEELVSSAEAPDELFSRKLWALNQVGYSRERLIDLVVLLQGCSFTSHLTERLHASAAGIKKRHPEYTSATLAARSFVHMFRHAHSKKTI